MAEAQILADERAVAEQKALLERKVRIQAEIQASAQAQNLMEEFENKYKIQRQQLVQQQQLKLQVQQQLERAQKEQEQQLLRSQLELSQERLNNEQALLLSQSLPKRIVGHSVHASVVSHPPTLLSSTPSETVFAHARDILAFQDVHDNTGRFHIKHSSQPLIVITQPASATVQASVIHSPLTFLDTSPSIISTKIINNGHSANNEKAFVIDGSIEELKEESNSKEMQNSLRPQSTSTIQISNSNGNDKESTLHNGNDNEDGNGNGNSNGISHHNGKGHNSLNNSNSNGINHRNGNSHHSPINGNGNGISHRNGNVNGHHLLENTLKVHLNGHSNNGLKNTLLQEEQIGRLDTIYSNGNGNGNGKALW